MSSSRESRILSTACYLESNGIFNLARALCWPWYLSAIMRFAIYSFLFFHFWYPVCQKKTLIPLPNKELLIKLIWWIMILMVMIQLFFLFLFFFAISSIVYRAEHRCGTKSFSASIRASVRTLACQLSTGRARSNVQWARRSSPAPWMSNF